MDYSIFTTRDERCWRGPLGAALVVLLAAAPFACRRGQGAPAGETSASAEAAAPGEPIDTSALNVCQRVPGKEVAQALSGELSGVLPFPASDEQPARCRYAVKLSASGRSTERAYIVYLMTPSDFDKRRVQVANPMTPVPKLADVAYVTYAPAGEAATLFVLKRGTAAIEIMGEDRAQLVKIARVVLAHL